MGLSLFIELLLVSVLFGSCTPVLVLGDETTRLLLTAGDKAMSRGRAHYREALAKYTEAHVRSPQSERALYSRAQLFSLLGDCKAALGDLDALLKQSPDHLQGLALRMSLNVHCGGLKAALMDATKLEKVYGVLGKLEKQKEVRRQIVKLNQYDARWRSLSGLMQTPIMDYKPAAANATLKRQYQECVDLLDHIIQDFAKDSLSLRLRRASCALGVGDNQVCSNEVRRVLSRDPQNLIAIALNAKALRALGSIEQSRSELRRCLSIDPEYAPCAKLHRLVRSQQKHSESITRLISAKQFKKAVAKITDAMKEEEHPPHEEQLNLWLCDAYVGSQDAVKGHQACSRALKLIGNNGPTAANVHLNLAELFLLEDELDKATQEVQEAKNLQGDGERVNILLRKIDNMRRNAGRKDYYKILGVKKTASAQEIRRVYRKLAKEYHPDQLRSKDLSKEQRTAMEKRFRDMNEAKEVLLSDEKRARYDAGEDVMQPQGQGSAGQPFYGQRFHFNTNTFPQAFANNFFRHAGGGAQAGNFYFFQQQ